MNRSVLPTLLIILSKYSGVCLASTFEGVPNYDIQVAPDHGKGSFGSWLYGEDNKPSKSSYSTKQDKFRQQNFIHDPQEAGHIKRHGKMYEAKKGRYLKYLSPVEDGDDQTTISPKEDRLVESLNFVSIWTTILKWLSCIIGFGCDTKDSATVPQ